MEIMEILKNAVKYPFNDIKTLLIVGVIFLLMTFAGLLGQYEDSAVLAVGLIINFLLVVFISGYSLDVIKFGTELNDSLPSLDIKNNFINGLKLIVVNIVYYIIPAIIMVGVTIIAGGYAFLSLENVTIAENANPAEILNAAMTPEMISAVGIVILVAIILSIIFGLIALMGQARLAKTGDIGNAVSFSQSIKDLRTIGIGKTLALLILLHILILIILFIFLIISVIPIIGGILFALFGESIIMFIQYRAYGLLYSEI